MKREKGLQGNYNNTSLHPRGAGILLPSCQNLFDALPYGGRSLFEGKYNVHSPVQKLTCPVHVNGPGVLGINEQKKNTAQFPLTST